MASVLVADPSLFEISGGIREPIFTTMANTNDHEIIPFNLIDNHM